MKIRIEFANVDRTPDDLRNQPAKHVRLSDQLKLEVVLKTQVVPVVGQAPEAIQGAC